MHHALRCFVEHRPHHLIATARYFAAPIDLARLIPGAGQPKHRPDGLGFAEPGRHIDSSAIGQRHHGADTRGRHQAPAYLILPDDSEQAAVQDDDLFTHAPPDDEPRLHQHRQVGDILDKLLDAGLEPHLANHSDLEAEVAQEAGPLSQWLFSALAEAELPVICVEPRHMQAVLKAQINKTDRNDARGIAQMIRVGLYRPVHVKTLRSQKLRMLLTHRKLLQSKAIAIENDLRGTLRNFGLKVGMVGKLRFEVRIQELVENIPDLAVLVEPLLVVRRALREQIVVLHRRLLAIVREGEGCRRLMTTPGVGPVVALTYRATVDVPARFRKSKSVGAVFGLTCSRYQSGEIDWSGRISRCGDEMMRVMLYEAAQSMVRSKKWCWLKAWAMQIARRRGMKKE